MDVFYFSFNFWVAKGHVWHLWVICMVISIQIGILRSHIPKTSWISQGYLLKWNPSGIPFNTIRLTYITDKYSFYFRFVKYFLYPTYLLNFIKKIIKKKWVFQKLISDIILIWNFTNPKSPNLKINISFSFFFFFLISARPHSISLSNPKPSFSLLMDGTTLWT